MDLTIGIILVVIGFILNQWMNNKVNKDAMRQPFFLVRYPVTILIITVLWIGLYIVGVYFLYKVSFWIPTILVGLYALLILSIKRGKQKTIFLKDKKYFHNEERKELEKNPDEVMKRIRNIRVD